MKGRQPKYVNGPSSFKKKPVVTPKQHRWARSARSGTCYYCAAQYRRIPSTNRAGGIRTEYSFDRGKTWKTERELGAIPPCVRSK